MTDMISTRPALKSLTGAAAASSSAPLSWAQTLPAKHVCLHIPDSASGGSAVVARGLPGQMGKALGQIQAEQTST